MAKAKKLKSGSWRVQACVVVNGEKLKRSFTATTAKEAEKAAEDWQTRCRMIGGDFTRMTVKEAILYYIEVYGADLSPTTIREYNRIAENDMTDIITKPLYSLTCPMIKMSMNKALETLQPKTVKNRYSLLRRILTVFHPSFIWAIEYPKQKKPQKKMYSNEYIKQICAAVKGTRIELESYLGMLSMRESEIAGAKWEDVDFQKKTLHVCRTKLLNKNNEYVVIDRTKTDASERTIYLPDYVVELLKTRRKRSTGEYISTMLPHQYWDALNYILKRQNVEHLRFHDLRHIYSSVSSRLGIDSQIRMENGGWSNEKVMDGHYRHAMTEAQEEANEKMNKFMNDITEVTTPVHTNFKRRLKIVRYEHF